MSVYLTSMIEAKHYSPFSFNKDEMLGLRLRKIFPNAFTAADCFQSASGGAMALTET